MSRRLLIAALAALGLWLAGGSTPARASGCAKVKLGTATVSEAAGAVSFTISADELPAPDPPADPPPPDSPPPNLGDGGIIGDPPPPGRRARAFCTVSYTTSDGTATAGADYSAVNGSVALDPGEKTAISVPILDDAYDEPAESFTVGLAGEPPETITITDNDLPAPPSPPKPPAGPGTTTQPTTTTTTPGGDGGGSPQARPLAPLSPANDGTPPVILISPPVEHASGPVWIVTCPATEVSCAGTVRLTALPAGRRAHAAARRKVVTLGSARYRLKGGESKRVKVKLNKRARKLVRKAKTLRAKATFTTSDASGSTSTTSQLITLHATAFRHS